MLIYKIVPRALWRTAEATGQFRGAPVDLADGFIHFSNLDQLAETAAKHFAEQDDLLLIEVEADDLGHQLRWEPSRNSQLFPHLYDALDLKLVLAVYDFPRTTDGAHQIPRRILRSEPSGVGAALHQRITQLEELFSHHQNTVDQLNAIVIQLRTSVERHQSTILRQQNEIETLQDNLSEPPANERPPHY